MSEAEPLLHRDDAPAGDEKADDAKKQGFQEIAQKVLSGLATAADAALPHVLKYYALGEKYYTIAKTEWDKRTTPEINNVVLGAVLCLYGGCFPALLAAVIAVNQSGQWPNLKKGVQEIFDQTTKATEVLKDDAMVKMLDTDKDGKVSMSEIAAGLQANGRGLIAEATPLVLKRVDPTVLNTAFTSVWAIFLQVSVTLQSVFARQIALGMRIGEIASGGIKQYAVPMVSKNLDKEHKHWAEWSVTLAAKLLGAFIAMFLAKIVGGFHAAMQGGELVAKGTVALGQKYGLVQPGNTQDLQTGVMYAAAVAGFWMQLKSGFSMNIFLRLLLFPLVLAEWAISLFCYKK